MAISTGLRGFEIPLVAIALTSVCGTRVSHSSRHLKRNIYIAALAIAAAGISGVALSHPTVDPWNIWGVAVLFGAMVVGERLAVAVPRAAQVSVATIPHIVGVLLLPPWLVIALAAASMLVDQLIARAAWPKVVFNVSSVVLTVGLAALLADSVGLERQSLGQPGAWLQVPAFLFVAATYYAMTNGLAAIVMSLDRGEPAMRIFLDMTRFTLPAEFAVCGIGGLVAVMWVTSPAWAPLVLFPSVVSQAALAYISSSKRRHARLGFLAEASRVLGLSLDENELPKRVAQLAVPTLADTCAVYLTSRNAEVYQAALTQGPADSGHPGGPELKWWAVRALTTRRGQLMTDIRDRNRDPQTVEACEQLRRFGVRSLMSVPLLASDSALGAIVLLTSARTYDADDLALAEDLARRSAVAIENAQLHAEARRSSRLRDEFLSVAAHELKTPVTTLRGYAQLLGRSLGDRGSLDAAMLAKGLRAIDSQSEKLGRLTHQLLDVSRIESGKLQLERREVDVSKLVLGIAAGVQAGAHEHIVHVNVSDTCIVFADALRLEQVINNLLSNAVKYSPSGGPIDVRLERIQPEVISLQVRDWGVGVPVERRSQLFDRFYQAHGEGHFGGLGLGLYISRQIVQLHGGRIGVDFPPEGGTCFTVELPALSADPAFAGAVSPTPALAAAATALT